MGDLTSLNDDYVLDWVVGKTTPPAAATRYLTVSDASLPGGTEQLLLMNGTANRIALTPASVFSVAASGSAIASQAVIIITASSQNAALIAYVSIWNSNTDGNMIAQAVITPKHVTIGDNFTIPIGSLTFTIT